MTDTQTEDRTRVDEAKDRAADVAGSAGEKAGQVVDQAKDEAAQVATAAAERATDIVGSARTELRDRAQAEAGNVGERLGAIAGELRAMGQASSDNGGMAAGLVNNLADRVEQGGQRLSDGDLDRVLADVKRFARNQPGVFLLGAAGAGFLIGRVLRSADLKAVGEAAKPGSDSSDGSDGSSTGSLPSPSTAAIGSAAPTPNPGSTPTPEVGTSPTTPDPSATGVGGPS
jgi:hypothetical protein